MRKEKKQEVSVAIRWIVYLTSFVTDVGALRKFIVTYPTACYPMGMTSSRRSSLMTRSNKASTRFRTV